MSLAKSKVEEVLIILSKSTWTDEKEKRFDIHDARWCIKLLAEALAAKWEVTSLNDEA